MKTELAPYIFFKGNCREAMEFYKSIFGGELAIQTYADVKMDAPEDMDSSALMHSRLASGDFEIMGSDTAGASASVKKVALSLMGSDAKKLRKYFDDLSAGGKVLQKLEKQFWGDTFGSLTDKYGVDWMINISSQ